jgi:Leucine-rich repeat (LRR) protein
MKTNQVIILLMIGISISCRYEQKKVEKKVSKLEQLMLFRADSAMDYFDLSNDSLSIFPDLSAYRIKSLDISTNQIDTLIIQYLPQEIEELNISHNKLTDFPDFSKMSIRYLDLSHNSISQFDENLLSEGIEKIYLSYNNLSNRVIFISSRQNKVLNFSHNAIREFGGFIRTDSLDLSHNKLMEIDIEGTIGCLNISYNPNMPNKIFYPKRKAPQINVFIKNNIANDNPIIFVSRPATIKFAPSPYKEVKAPKKNDTIDN